MEVGATPDGEAAGWFFENALDVFVVLHDGAITSANAAWCAFTGYSREQTIGRSYWSFTHPDERESLLAMVAQVFETGTATGEHRCLTASGEWRWNRSRAKRMDDGRTLLALNDITEEREAAARSEQLARVAELLSVKAGVFIWRFDSEAAEYDFSPLAPVTSRTRPRIGRDAFRTSIHPEDVGRTDVAWEKVLATGEGDEVTYRQWSNGVWRRLRTAWLGVSVQAGGQWDVLGITQDITELTAARDAALEAVEIKTQFLANISHEIRTPMNGVLGVLHLLKSDVLTPGARALVSEALASGSTLAQVLNDIIDFSKIEGGRLDMTPEPAEIAREVEVVVGMLRPEAEALGLTLELDCAPDLGWGFADPVRVRQMAFNLIGNAVKFTRRGGVKVRVTASGSEEARGFRLEVEDTGIGVPARAQATLFDVFQQADASSTRQFGGAGLGLAITKALAERMGGTIGFVSQEGRGSTFWVEFRAPACPAVIAKPIGRWLEGVRVLLVEDNATNRLIATRMLAGLGAQVDVAEDGAQGVACVQAAAYDLILMDIQMPVMDGVEAARAIRALPGAVAQTPILAVTANVLPRQIESYLAVGMDGYVAKPISPAAMMAEITRLAARVDGAAA